jgi:predicted acyl esterase
MAERHVWIPMADGVRLAASLHLPDSADPCPVLLEALPYRKDDVTAGGRQEYRRLAGEHGYGSPASTCGGRAPRRTSPPTSTRRWSRPTSAG